MLGSGEPAAGQPGSIRRARFGVDHNFPEPILDAVEPFLPFDVRTIHRIDRRLTEEMEDWQVILALHQLGYDGLITADYNITQSPREVATVHQTNATLVAIQSAGDNPLRAVGQLLVQAVHVARGFEAGQPQIFRVREPRAVTAISAWARLGEMASDMSRSIQDVFDEVRLSSAEFDTPVL